MKHTAECIVAFLAIAAGMLVCVGITAIPAILAAWFLNEHVDREIGYWGWFGISYGAGLFLAWYSGWRIDLSARTKGKANG